MNIENFLKQMLLDIGIENDDINYNSELQNELGLDSTEIVDLSLSIKKEYGISVNLSSKNDLTLNQVCVLIEKELTKKGGTNE